MCPRRLLHVIAPVFAVMSLGCAGSGEVPGGEEAAVAEGRPARAEAAVQATPTLHEHVSCPNHGRPDLPHHPSQDGDTIEATYVRIGYPANTFPGPGVVRVLPEPHLHGFRLSQAPQQDVEVWFRLHAAGCQGWGSSHRIDASGQILPTQTRTWNGATWAVGTIPDSAFSAAADSVGATVTGFVILSN